MTQSKPPKKPSPQSFIGEGVEYSIGYFWGKKGGALHMIGEIRGWGAIQNLFKKEGEAQRFQDELGEWIANAINQKLKSEN